MEKSKLKYLKSFHDWEESEANYQESEKDGTLARNEILRIKLESEAKHKYYIHQTEAYQNQLKATNSTQNNYYKILLPDILDKLETLETNRLDFIKDIFLNFINSENEANVIMNKCRCDMENIVTNIKVENDINLVVDVNKSGKLAQYFKYRMGFLFELMISMSQLKSQTKMMNKIFICIFYFSQN